MKLNKIIIFITFLMLTMLFLGCTQTKESITPNLQTNELDIEQENSTIFGFNNSKIVMKDNKGEFVEVKDNNFRRGDDVYLMLENVGEFSDGPTGTNWYDVDVEITDSENNVVYSKKELYKHQGKVNFQDNIAKSIYGVFNSNYLQQESGEYNFVLTVYDKNGLQSITETLSFILSDVITIKRCEGIIDSVLRSRCYYDSAKVNKNVDGCQKASPSQALCAIEIDINKSVDLKKLDLVCSSSDGESTTSNCYEDIAVHRNNIEFCNKVSTATRVTCLLRVDKNRSHSLEELDEGCASLNDSYYRGLCYDRLASHRNEESFCEKAESLKNLCKTKFR